MTFNKTLQNIGIGVTVFGIILLIVMSIYNILTTDVDLIYKISTVTIVLGIILTLFALIKEKIQKKDTMTERKY